MAGSPKKIIEFPFIIISPFIAKICSKDVPPAVSIALNESYEKFMTVYDKSEPKITSTRRYPLCDYPIHLKFDQSINIHEIRAIWENYISFIPDVVHCEMADPMVIQETQVPFLAISNNCQRLEMSPVDDFIQRIGEYESSSELKLADSKSKFDRKYLARNFSIVLDYKLIIERFEIFFLNHFQSKNKISVEMRSRILNSFRNMVKRVAKCLIFRFCKNHLNRMFTPCNFLQVDGSSIITQNPLLTLFFFFSFAPKAFINQDFNSLTNLRAIELCLKAVITESKIFPVYNYFILIRNKALPKTNPNYIFGDFKCPQKMTYTLLKRITLLRENTKDLEIENMNNRKEYLELKGDSHKLNTEKRSRMEQIKASFNKIQNDWNSTYFQYFDNANQQMKSGQFFNFFRIFKSNHSKDDFVQNQLSTTRCIQMLDWTWLNKLFQKAVKENQKKTVELPMLADDDHHIIPPKKDDDHHSEPPKVEKPKRKYNKKAVVPSNPVPEKPPVVPEKSEPVVSAAMVDILIRRFEEITVVPAGCSIARNAIFESENLP